MRQVSRCCAAPVHPTVVDEADQSTNVSAEGRVVTATAALVVCDDCGKACETAGIPE